MKTANTPTIECHPPERRRRTEVRVCHGSCSCCCCCLHTVGGIVGAAIAPTLGGRSTAWSHLSLIEDWEEEDYQPGPATDAKDDLEAITEKPPTAAQRPLVRASAVPDIGGKGVSAVRVFWLLSLAVSIVGALIGATQGGSGFVIGLIILLFVFPAVQLVCAIITLIWLALSSRQDKSFQMRQLAKIFLGMMGGAASGSMAMSLMLVPFVGRGIGAWLLAALATAMVFLAGYFGMVKVAGVDRLWAAVYMVVGMMATIVALWAMAALFFWR